MRTIRNWAGNIGFQPKRFIEPRSVDELRKVIQSSKKVRVVGSGHSWSEAIVTDDTLVSLNGLRDVVEIDAAQKQITAQAGIKLSEVNKELDKRGLALTNLGSIATQSLAGAMSTGTHGTGVDLQCLASQVASFRMLDAEGREHSFNKVDENFCAMLIGLGGFGVIYEMTLDVTDAFQLHEVSVGCDFDEAIDDLDRCLAEHDHVKFWWLPPSKDVVLFAYNRTDDAVNDSHFRQWFKDEFISVYVYRMLSFVGLMNRERFIPPINRFLTRQITKPLDRIEKSYKVFNVPEPPPHRETEWAFDLADAKHLLREYKKLLTSNGFTYNFIQEIRFSKGDDFWLSPAYRRNSIWLGMYNKDLRDWNKRLANFEAFARAHNGRPHWGKEFTIDAKYLAAQYEKLDDLRDLLTKFDRSGKFRNAWLNAIFL